MKKFLLFAFAISSACVAKDALRPILEKSSVVSALNDFQTKKTSNGQLVSITGFLTFGDDKHNIWQSRKDYEYVRDQRPNRNDPAWKQCIALDDYGAMRSRLIKYDGKQVTVAGYISLHTQEDDEINLGSCSDVRISLGGKGARVTVG